MKYTIFPFAYTESARGGVAVDVRMIYRSFSEYNAAEYEQFRVVFIVKRLTVLVPRILSQTAKLLPGTMRRYPRNIIEILSNVLILFYP